jgi:hypothetical protein
LQESAEVKSSFVLTSSRQEARLGLRPFTDDAGSLPPTSAISGRPLSRTSLGFDLQTTQIARIRGFGRGTESMRKFLTWALAAFVAAVTVSICLLSAALVSRFVSANGRLLVIAFLLLGLAAGSILPGSAHAEEDCLAAPSGRAPPGGKWLYRTDNVKQRKCWRLRTQGDASQRGAVAAPPAAVRATLNPDQAGNRQLEQRSATSPALSGTSVKQDRLVADAASWPDPPSAGAPDNTAWPDPPTQTGHGVWPDPPAPIAADKVEEPGASVSNHNVGSAPGPKRHVTTEIAITRSAMSIGILLSFIMGLVITGIVVRRLAKVDLGQRHGIEPDQLNAILDDGSKQALRGLLQTVEQQAVHGTL